ncbi:MAG: biotin--[acetyl-CoA-carboxylase] ligase [Actinomycetota bacterium]
MIPPERPGLDRALVGTALAPPWTQIAIIDATRSTNADLLATADTTAEGAVLVAEHQTAGRGRLERTWVSPARSALTFSVLLRPTTPTGTWGWLPLLAGVALRDAVARVGVGAMLKWPNDLLVGPRPAKAAGLLAQVAGDAVVLGIGLNVNTTQDELPVPTATSLVLAGGSADRSALLVDVLGRLGQRYRDWLAAGGDAERCGLAADYRRHCATIGRRVAVTGTDGALIEATATGVDADGRLVLDVGAGNERVIAAGDVAHLRPATR